MVVSQLGARIEPESCEEQPVLSAAELSLASGFLI